MILKNSWGKYDNMWVIGDIRLARKPDFRMECHSKKTGTVLYEGAEGAEKYMQSTFVSEFAKIVYSILDEHIKNGTESLGCLELAVQHCIRLGMFDDEYPKNQINAFIEEMKGIPEKIKEIEKNEDIVSKLAVRDYENKLMVIGGDPNNITIDGMKFIERRTYEDLVREHALPKYIFPDERSHAFREFFHNLRFTITHFIRAFVFEEIPTPSYEDGRLS